MPKYPIIEHIDSDLGELLDRFFDVSHKDLEAMQGALAARDFAELVRLGHTIKGTGSGYGFKGMGKIGQGIELAANAQDLQMASEQVDHLAWYLDTVQVEFKDYPGSKDT